MLPRGIRNHNPLNVRRSKDQWKGMAEVQTKCTLKCNNKSRWSRTCGFVFFVGRCQVGDSKISAQFFCKSRISLYFCNHLNEYDYRKINHEKDCLSIFYFSLL